MILSGSAVQVKGFGCWLCSAGGLEIDDGVEDAAFQAALGKLGEVAFYRVET
jgi:hypothetical protein